MKVGWMWFDNNPRRSIEEKIQRAVQSYRTKFGRFPNTCYVNQRSITGDGFRCGKVKVVPAPNILPHHFWLGVSDASPGKNRRSMN
jgi:hypothetical protein